MQDVFLEILQIKKGVFKDNTSGYRTRRGIFKLKYTQKNNWPHKFNFWPQNIPPLSNLSVK